MADKKSGPVKPPIIDAKPRGTGTPDPTQQDAQTAGPAAPADAPAPKQSEAQTKPGSPSAATPPSKSAPADKAPSARPEPKKERTSATGTKSHPAPDAPRSSSVPSQPAGRSLPIPLLAATAASGALAGVLIAYGLAASGLWPQTQADQDPAFAELQSRIAQIETALAETQPQDASAQIDTIATELSARIDNLAAAETITEGLAAQADLDALSRQLGEVSTRLEALTAGVPGDESTQFAGQLTELSDQMTDLSARIDAIEPQIDQWAPVIEQAQSRLDDLDARIANQSAFDALSADRDRVARLPVALTALETAIASGASFAGQLSDAEALLPGLLVDAEARTLAATGAPTAATLLADFRSALPEILAARPRDPDAHWAQDLLDQAGAAIALRPTQGDSPQALVGTIETALGTGDFATARDIFAQLPETMQQAAPGFASDLDAALSARALLDTVRSAQSATPQAEIVQ